MNNASRARPDGTIIKAGLLGVSIVHHGPHTDLELNKRRKAHDAKLDALDRCILLNITYGARSFHLASLHFTSIESAPTLIDL